MPLSTPEHADPLGPSAYPSLACGGPTGALAQRMLARALAQRTRRAAVATDPSAGLGLAALLRPQASHESLACEASRDDWSTALTGRLSEDEASWRCLPAALCARCAALRCAALLDLNCQRLCGWVCDDAAHLDLLFFFVVLVLGSWSTWRWR